MDPPPLSPDSLRLLRDKCISSYESVLLLQSANSSLFKYDTLQRIHALHNLARALREGGLPRNGAREAELEKLELAYMGQRVMEWQATKKKLKEDEMMEYKEEIEKVRWGGGGIQL